MIDDERHRRLREHLGSYALGHLPDPLADMVGAHLDGCAACRAELAELMPAVTALEGTELHGELEQPVPPPGLGERIRAAVADEHAEQGYGENHRPRSRRRRVSATPRQALAAASVAVLVGLGGVTVGRVTAPEPPRAPLEAIDLVAAAGSGVEVSDASLVPHTWGVEVRFAGTGFDDGEVFTAAVRDSSGELEPAGEFVGNGSARVTCQMQSGLLRAESTEFVVTDDSGEVVLTAALPTTPGTP